MNRYVIGYVGVQTGDGRTIVEPPTCDGVIPVMRGAGGEVETIGTASDLQIDKQGVMTIATDVDVDDERQVLSLSILGSRIDESHPATDLLAAPVQRIAIVGGRLAGLVVLDRASWAWRNVPRGTSADGGAS